MAAVLEVIDEGGYFFLDSMTTPNSVVEEVAESMGVPFLINQTFIDSDFDPDAMHARLLSIGRTAQRQGSAVAIGHVHPATIEALYRALPELQQRGIELVHISALLPDVPKVKEFGLAPGIQQKSEQTVEGEKTLPSQLFRGRIAWQSMQADVPSKGACRVNRGKPFRVVSPYEPAGDQPKAIRRS